MISRDLIQGFIDGYVATGGDASFLGNAISQYLINHPTYPQDIQVANTVVSDVSSYRITAQDVLAPTPIVLAPSIPVVSTPIPINP